MAGANAHALIKRASLGLSRPYVAPQGALETLLATIFAEVFSLDEVGASDDFFDLGGDSLIAELLGMAISERTGQRFEISQLLEHGSPRRAATLLKPKTNETVA